MKNYENIFTTQVPPGTYDATRRAPAALTSGELRELEQRIRHAKYLAWLHADHYPLMPGFETELETLLWDIGDARELTAVA